MTRHNNKWIHGTTNLVMPPTPSGFMSQAGIYYLSLVLDKSVGEEIVLIIFDPTDFIYQLSNLVPFNFYMSGMAINTSFGPVVSFIFWITQPKDKSNSFAIYDKPIDISQPLHIQPWQTIAKQTHLHLLLLDKNRVISGFYEFDNVFGIEDAVEMISQLDSTRVRDFGKAKQEYFDKYSLKQLYEMIKGNLNS